VDKDEDINFMKSRVQEYLAKKEKTQKSNLEVGEPSPLPTEELMQIVNKLRGKHGHTPTEAELLDLITPLIPKVQDGKTPSKEELLKLIVPLIPKVKDGMTPVKGKHYFTDDEIKYWLERITPIKGKHYFDGKDGRPGRPGKDAIMPDLRALATTAINLLETFEGDDRLDVKAIKNIEKLIRKIVSQEWNYGGPGVIFHDTSLVGDGSPGAPLKVVGGGVHFETPVGVLDGVNVNFVVANTPKAVILNQQTYFQDDGYTFNSITMTITMLVTPVAGSTLRSMY
jgi:hypothetical protein